MYMNRTVQPTKPAPAFTSSVASSSKAFEQTLNVVSHATHTELSIESNRGDQNLSQPLVGLTGQAERHIPTLVMLVLPMKTLILIQVTILVSWRGEEAVSGFANRYPKKTLAMLTTKPSGLRYDLRCIRAYDQPYNQSSDRPVTRM